MQVNIITKDKEWNSVIKRSPSSTFYHTTTWRKLLEKYGCKGFLIGAEDEDSIAGILPIYVTKSRLLHLKQFESIPFCDQNGLLVSQNPEKTMKVLLETLKESTKEHHPVRSIIQSKNLPDCDIKIQPKFRYLFKTEGIELKDAWKKILNRKARKAVSSAINRGGTPLIKESIPFFKEHYEMYRDVMGRRNILIGKFSEEFFKDVFKITKKHLKVFIVKSDDRIISSNICFHYNDVLHAWSLASCKDTLKNRPNDLLFWEIIKWGIKNKCKYVEFGTVPVEGEVGLHTFKDKYKTDLEKTYSFEMKHSWKADFEDFMFSVGKNIKNGFF